MAELMDVATLSDLPPGTCLSVEVSGVLIALFNVEGRIFATSNTCPHAGGPLGEGLLQGEVVECPWHGWRFNVRTGVRPENPQFAVPTYEVQIEGERIRVAVPLP